MCAVDKLSTAFDYSDCLAWLLAGLIALSRYDLGSGLARHRDAE